MAIIRWEPFQDADTLRYRLNKLFDGMDATRVESWTRQENWTPAIELRESKDHIQLQVALSGIEPEDLDVQVSQNAVLLSGDRQQTHQMQSEEMVASEFLYGSFRRVIPLHVKVNSEAAAAEMNHGLLTLMIPKADEERNRVVKVRINSDRSEPNAVATTSQNSISSS